ncbi:ferredoxin [Escherichia coli]|nr:ferredoxin [Escherichia coli]
MPVVHFSTSLFTGLKLTMLAVPFPAGSLNKYPLSSMHKRH